MFYDRAKIYVRSGDGGDGMISFRREKFVPYGGPDGADGGDGGSIIIKTNPNLNSLIRFHRSNHYRAEHGVNGNTKRRTGARGASITLEVPLGTTIRNADTEDLLADMIHEDQEVILVAGGRGGRGNIHFSSSVNRAPRIAERGEPGEELWLNLELKLIADVGIVGVPNAGKSTLISVVSQAKPKIANYPFTTLQPNLGVVLVDEYESMVWADIPGLIEGAAQGIGLGHDFLRHVERTRVLVHLLDGMAENPLEDWAKINQELSTYDRRMMEKPQLVVLNKMDTVDGEAWEPLVREQVEKEGYEFMSISAVTQHNTRELIYKVYQLLSEAPETNLYQQEEETVIRAIEDDDAFTIAREFDGGWRVSGKSIERIAAMTYFEFDSTALRFQRILDARGITKALAKAGVQEGDLVRFGEQELEWQPE